MDLSRIDTIIQFTQGTTSIWNSVSEPVPAGAIIIDTANKIIKEGDGITLFANLPVCLDYNFHSLTSGAVAPESTDVDKIAIAKNSVYNYSSTKLNDLIANLSTLSEKYDEQQVRINNNNGINVVSIVEEGINDGTYIICQNNQYVPSNRTINQLISDLIKSLITISASMHITDLEWYSDTEMTQLLDDQNNIAEHNTYWCKVTGFHDSCELKNVSFNMTSNSANVDIVSTTPSNTGSKKMITNIYSSLETDQFVANTSDNNGNVIAVGLTTVDDTQLGLIVKFDSSFNVIARKIYSGNYRQFFNSVITNSDNEIIAVGCFSSTIDDLNEAFIVKFDSDLNDIIAQKTYGATGDDVFNDITIDSSGNFIVVGYTTSEGSGLKDGLVIKFNPTLNVVYKKYYGGTGNDIFNSVTLDPSGNIIIVGHTGSEGANVSGLILKIDGNLNIILRKYYNSTYGTATEFSSVIVTSTNFIYAVGRVVIASGNKGLIVKYDASLNSVANKLYGNEIGSTEFTGVKSDSNANVFVAGKTNAEGAGNYDALVVKFDEALIILGRKTYGTIGEDANIDCNIASDNDIILSGYSVIDGTIDGMITKLPNSLPAGLYTNKYLNELILSDSKLSLTEDNGVSNSSTTNLATSNLIVSNGNMVIANATGAIVCDTTIVDAISNVFEITFNEITNNSINSVIFTISTNDGDKTVSKNVAVNVVSSGILEAICGDNEASFASVCIDSSNNIYAVGSDNYEGSSLSALIVKFDSEFNVIAQKIYDGTAVESFDAVTVDPSGNVYVFGRTQSEGTGIPTYFNILVVKFDSNLNIVARKVIGGASNDIGGSIAADAYGNIYAVGGTNSEGETNTNALIIKFDSNLNILARKVYGGTGIEFFHGMAFDSSNNIYVCGQTSSESVNGYRGLIVKFDTSLNILLEKAFSVSNFYDIAIDSNNFVYVVGSISVSGITNSLIVKMNALLEVLSGRSFSETVYNNQFDGVSVDSTGNVYAVGQIYFASGSTNSNAELVKFNSNLEVLSNKNYGHLTTNDWFYDITNDSFGNAYVVGRTNSQGAVIIKLSQFIPSGSLVGTILTGLVLADSTSVMSVNNVVSVDLSLTVGNSTLAVSNSGLTLSNSILELIKDTLL